MRPHLWSGFRGVAGANDSVVCASDCRARRHCAGCRREMLGRALAGFAGQPCGSFAQEMIAHLDPTRGRTAN